jgi:anthranilate synthase component 2
MTKHVVVIDNFDSFTYNIVHYLAAAGCEPIVYRNDAVGVDEIATLNPDAIVMSPGPGTPDSSGVCMDVLAAARDGLDRVASIPILGVCLGHQAIGQSFGARVVRAPNVFHGKSSTVIHDQKGLFAGLATPIVVGRYHSLIVDRDTLPAELVVTAQTHDGIVMGMSHSSLPIVGVQFHPESVLTQFGQQMINNFVDGLPG